MISRLSLRLLLVQSLALLLERGCTRYGRKARVKVGEKEIEVEAQTVVEVEKLFAPAQDIPQRNKPKAIHEP